MQGSTVQGKGGMVNAGEYLPGKRRHGKCRVVPSRERQSWQMKGSAFQGNRGMSNVG